MNGSLIKVIATVSTLINVYSTNFVYPRICLEVLDSLFIHSFPYYCEPLPISVARLFYKETENRTELPPMTVGYKVRLIYRG